jgi:hypothetical protein
MINYAQINLNIQKLLKKIIETTLKEGVSFRQFFQIIFISQLNQIMKNSSKMNGAFTLSNMSEQSNKIFLQKKLKSFFTFKAIRHFGGGPLKLK